MLNQLRKHAAATTALLFVFVVAAPSITWRALAQAPANSVTVPPGFQVETFYSGAPLANPWGLAFSPDGKVIVADAGPVIGDCASNDGAVYAISMDHSVTTLVSGNNMEESQGLAFGNGNGWGNSLYIADSNAYYCVGAVFKLNDAGASSPLTTLYTGVPWSPGQDGDPSGLAFGPGGDFGTDLYVSDQSSGGSGAAPGGIYKLNPSGAVTPFVFGLPLLNPLDMAFGHGDFGNYLYVADFNNAGDGGHVWRIDASGTITPFAGGDGSPFRKPSHIAFGKGGAFGTDLYVYDDHAGNIFRVDASGNISVFASGSTFRTYAGGMTFSSTGDALYFTNGNDIMRITSAAGTCSTTVTVPGIANPFLAGMPNGSTDDGFDSAPEESPVLVNSISTNGVLTFSVTGATGNCPGCTAQGPDGLSSSSPHLFGASNGIGDVYAPTNALIGVFLDDNRPDLTPAPSERLDFSTPESRDYLTISPALKQPFFIGDGRTSAGAVQQVVPPPGATRLYLGSMDGVEWSNNVGAFSVTVTGSCPTPTPTPADSTPPTISATVNGTQGNGGWLTSNVTVNLAAADEEGGSGIKQITYSMSGAQNIPPTTGSGAAASPTINTEGQTAVTYFATDNAGNTSAPQVLTVKMDKTTPRVSCGTADGAWHAGDVSITCSAGDAVSGLAQPSDSSFSLTTSVAAGSETANASTGSRTVCDVAGNCAAAGPVGGNRVDEKAPSITINAPTQSTYLLNQAVAANYSCADGGSGVATCAGTVASGSNINTASPGAKTFTVTATDNVGNGASKGVNYTVSYGVAALYDQTKAVKSGATVPIKVQLVDAGGVNRSSSSVVLHATGIFMQSTNAPETLQDAGNSNLDFDFRFDGSAYVFNLKTTGYPTGTFVLTFTAGGDPAQHSVVFAVR
jgi:hypothetical protein